MTPGSETVQSTAQDGRPPLFRPEVAERQWETLASRGLLPQPPRFARPVIAVLVVAFAAGCVLVVRGSIARVETAPGYLEPGGGVARVRAPRQGIVGAIHVADGQLVKAGDPLVTLQSGQTTESGAAAEAEIALQLRGQKQDLEAQIAREHDWRENEDRRLKLSVDDLNSDLDLLASALQTEREELTIAQRQADRIRDAALRGTVALDELERRDLAVLGQRLALQTSQRELASKRAQLEAGRIAIEQLPTIANERIRGLREALANVQQRMIELEIRRAVVIRAPLGGRVEMVPALAGATVDNDSLIATIVPESTELRARLFVPTRAIGKVHAGQSVLIRYEAFPYQKYGSFAGNIAEVSTSVLLPQEVGRVAPVRLNEPAYVVDVTLTHQSVALGGERQAALRPDMLLTAAIEIDRRPLLAWIGESVLGVAQN